MFFDHKFLILTLAVLAMSSGVQSCDPGKCSVLCAQQYPSGDSLGYSVVGACNYDLDFCECRGAYGVCQNC